MLSIPPPGPLRDRFVLLLCAALLGVACLMVLISYRAARIVGYISFTLYVAYRLVTLLRKRFKGEIPARTVIFVIMALSLAISLAGFESQLFVFMLLLALDYMLVERHIGSLRKR